MSTKQETILLKLEALSNLSDNITILAKDFCMPLEVVAEKANLSSTILEDIVAGHVSDLTLSEIASLAHVFGYTIDEILTEEIYNYK